MGEVYKARDTKLDRPVAIKFLSSTMADAAGRRRFQREAQLASSLNHPHILTVYNVGEHEGRQYLVTEFIDGGTLSDWAKAEKRTWRQIVDLLTGVADGLAAAHAATIMHRDIKPANILVARNGYAKLADFGLAKLVEGTDDATRAFTEEQTKAGVVVGTVAYMSPEQASGQKLDGRSDVFSFGIVLHEMLAGTRPFRGKSDLEILKSIIHGAPEPLPAETPAALRGVVEKALENDPADRYQSMREMVVDLRRSLRQGAEPALARVAPPKWARRWGVPALAAGLAVVSLAAVVYWRLDRSDYFWKNPLEEATFQKVTDWPGTELDAAISHDGKLVTFLADRDGFYDAFVTQVGTGLFRNLTQGINRTLLHETTRTTGFSADGAQIWLRTGPLSLVGPANQATTSTLSLIASMGGTLRPFLTPQLPEPRVVGRWHAAGVPPQHGGRSDHSGRA